MLLSNYVLSIIQNRATYTADAIEIDAALCQRFRTLMERSDSRFREYGFNLEWHASRQVRPGAQEFEGDARGTAVDLDCDRASQAFSYLGDFHTHPYRRKYGADVAVGPSNGDWAQWFHTPPRQKPLAVHCVASGTELFVLIFRTVPRPGSQPNFAGVTSDAGRLNDAVRDNDELGMAIYEAVAGLQAAGVRGDLAALDQAGTQHQAALRQHAPGLAKIHADDAEAMNVQLANNAGYEYYRGPLGVRGTTTVSLRSNRAVGNWVTSRVWASGTDPWVKLPSWWKR